MKFSKYILGYACLCVVGVTTSFSEFAESDPEVAKLKEKVNAQQGEIDAGKEEVKKLNTLIEETKTEVQKIQSDLKAGLTSVENEVKSNTQKLEQLSGLQTKIESLEKKSNQGASSKQMSAITKDLKNLKSEIQKLSTQNNNSELQLIKASLDNINTQLAEKKAIDEKQNIDSAKYAARLEKLEKQSNSSSKDPAMTNLMGTALQGGLGLLSNVFDLQKMKSKLANGQSAAASSKDLTPAEKTELAEIEKDISNGKSDQEIQQRLDDLNKKTASRKIAENKFPKIIFTGVNPGLKDKTLLRHITSQAEVGKKVNLSKLLSTSENDINQEVADSIYDMVQKNATVTDLRNSIKLIFSGNPGKTVKPKIAPTQQQPSTVGGQAQSAVNGLLNTGMGMLGNIGNQLFNKQNPQQSQNKDQQPSTVGGQQAQSAVNGLINTGMGMLGNIGNQLFNKQNPQQSQNKEQQPVNSTSSTKQYDPKYTEELMSVVDLSDGKHYDVEKGTFLSIAVPSYKSQSNVSKTNISKKTVEPIDSKAAKLLSILR